ncbi:MAG: glutamate decarboxylase [Acidimicrobiales bacterium]|nr:glutamate decarboxylase [Acidimicrobiales bacterium]
MTGSGEVGGTPARDERTVDPVFTRAGARHGLPRLRLPDGEILPQTAYQLVRDEVMLDGNARLNLATFVTTWMDPEADRLMAETAQKNMIDKDEYPQTADIERRCVRMLADLWHSPEAEHTAGVSCTGSSEACMLGGLALKRRWQQRRRAAGRPADRPNIVFGSNVQVVWEKFANFWEVEPRFVPAEGDLLHLTPERMLPFVDENTIGVVAILGSTFDGSYEPVADICAALDRLAAEQGIDVPVHVDAASGGFVAPFLDPDLVWDFRLERVASISTSGHKYGLVYPGVGWVVWRVAANLPDELVFKVNYLGGDMPTFALNFSRPGSQVIAQYYMFLRLGREGYRRIQQTCRDVALHLSSSIERLGPFELVTRGDELPVFAFKVKPSITTYTVFDLSRKLRERGWLVPAYTMPANREDLSVLRIVVRNGVSPDLAELFLRDLRQACDWLGRLSAPIPAELAEQSFHH